MRPNRSGAGFEPATQCLSGICSTQLSYPRLRIRPDLNRRPPDFSGALTWLSYECHVLRLAEHETRRARRAGRDQQPEP